MRRVRFDKLVISESSQYVYAADGTPLRKLDTKITPREQMRPSQP